MSRSCSIVLGSSLLALWLLAILLHASASLAWVDGAVGGLTLYLALRAPRRRVDRVDRCCLSMALAMGVLLVWALGMSLDAAPWLSWGTLVLAGAMLLLSFAATDAPRHGA
jgi:hypothetical protein